MISCLWVPRYDIDAGCFNSLDSSSQETWREFEVLTHFQLVFIHRRGALR